jgi:hypothetical protein
MRIYKLQVLVPKSQAGSRTKATNWMIEAESLEEATEVFHKFLRPQIAEQYPSNHDLIEIKSIVLQDAKGYFGDFDDSNIYTAVLIFNDEEADKKIKETWYVWSEDIQECYNRIETEFGTGGPKETVMDFETKSVKFLPVEGILRAGQRTSTVVV